MGRLFAAMALIVVSVGACGSGGSGTRGIAGFTACGGSLAGSWRVVATEVDIEQAETLEQAQRGVTGNIVTWMQLLKI